MTEGYTIQKDATPQGAVTYTVTRLSPAGDTILVTGLDHSPEVLTFISILLLRDVKGSTVTTMEECDELVKIELRPLGDRPYGVRTVPTDRIRRWLDSRSKAGAGEGCPG